MKFAFNENQKTVSILIKKNTMSLIFLFFFELIKFFFEYLKVFEDDLLNALKSCSRKNKKTDDIAFFSDEN